MSSIAKTVLVPPNFSASAASALSEAAEQHKQAVRCVRLPADPEARLDAADLDRLDVAFFGGNIPFGYARSFFSAVRKAPNLKWLHAFNAGVDHPVFKELLDRGVRLTTSLGTNAVPVARTAVTGLLMLSRGFVHWQAAQRRRRWELIPQERFPADLDT
jgi:D-2-hydroxyacid dehydrogenase (NADP+)